MPRSRLAAAAAAAALLLGLSGCGKNPTYQGGCLSGASGCRVSSPCQALSFTCATAGPLELRRLEVPEASAYGGSNELASAGDYLLTNGTVRVVIAQDGNQNYLDPHGGSILDLYTVDADGDGQPDNNDGINQILQVAGILPGDSFRYTEYEEIRDADRVALQLSGVLEGQPDVRVHTLYELRACDPGVRIRTELVNEGHDPRTYTLTDGYYWSKREPIPFAPVAGAGFEHPSFGLTTIDAAFRSFDYFGASTHAEPHASYSAVACNERQLVGFHSDTISAGGLPKTIVGPRDFQVFERFIAVAKSPDIAGAADLALEARRQLWDEAFVTLTGTVSRGPERVMGTEREVSVLISEGTLADAEGRTPWTQVVPDVTGHFAARVPAGRGYVIEVTSFGKVAAEKELASATADTDLGAFVLPTTARVIARVENGAGQGLHAELFLVPADGPTSTAAAGDFHGQFGTCSPWLGNPAGASPACDRVLVFGGDATFEAPVGKYHLYAFHGPFWTLGHQEVTLTATDHPVTFVLTRLGHQPAGTLTADLHIHGAPSFDSMIPDWDRVLSFAASDLQVAVGTDHDVVYDYRDMAEQLGIDGQVQTIVGMETTGHNPYLTIPGYAYPLVVGHYNFWPLSYDPSKPRNGGLFDEYVEPGQLMSRAAELYTGVGIAQLNHPWSDAEFGRDLGFPRAVFLNTLIDLPAEDDGTNQGVYVRRPRPGDPRNDDHHAQEVMNGTASGAFLQYRAFWFYTLNQGRLATGTANSDSHSLTDSTVGVPCNLVYANTTVGPAFENDVFNQAIIDGKVLGTNGPLIEAELDLAAGGTASYGRALLRPAPTGALHVRVKASPWIPVEEVRVVVNGKVVATRTGLGGPADPFGATGVDRFDGTFLLSDLLAGVSGDAWIVIEAGRPLVLADDLGGGLGRAKDGIPDTGDNNGDGQVTTADIGQGRSTGPLHNPPIPTDVNDPYFHFSHVLTGGYPLAFTNPFVLDRNNNGKFDAPGVSGGRAP